MPQKRAPVRQQIFRVGVVLLGPVIVILILLFAGQRLGFPADLIPIAVIAIVVVTGIGVALGLFIGSKLVGDRIEVALRPRGGKWTHGRLTPEPGGVLRFDKYWWQVRIPTGDTTYHQVERLGDNTFRKPKPAEWWSVNPQLRITTLISDHGTYDLGALPAHLVELRERLAVADSGDSR
jgi:hypothetical protein